MLYLFILDPFYKETIWGEKNLNRKKNIPFPVISTSGTHELKERTMNQKRILFIHYSLYSESGVCGPCLSGICI